jgi:hypothetical protein
MEILPKVGKTLTLMMGTPLARMVLPGSAEGAAKGWTRNLNVPKKDAAKVIPGQSTCMSPFLTVYHSHEFGRIANTS